MKYNLITEGGKPKSVTVFIGSTAHAVGTDHPHFNRILGALKAGKDDEVAELIDAPGFLSRNIHKVRKTLLGDRAHLLDRLDIKRGGITFDGKPLNDGLSRTIVQYMKDGNESYQPLVKFLAKVMENPNSHSREHLYNWLAKLSFTIVEDGDFVSYKGVDDAGDGLMRSRSSGTAVVDGIKVTGQIPNAVGSVIEMPRDEVTFDPQVGCSSGLHVGTWQYAKGFAPRVILVKVDPRDVVSVPTDSAHQKLRVCRYSVQRVIDRSEYEALDVRHADVPMVVS